MSESPGLRSILISALPFAAAIGAFGVIFGAAAGGASLEPLLTVAMSAFIFSGSLQFALLGLIASGAGPLTIIATAIALNSRHLVLGAVLRPRLHGSYLERALRSAFLLDESFGLAVAAGQHAPRVLVTSGLLFYAVWVGGTVLGVLGARVGAIEQVAVAAFPVLFIGLAAVTTRTRDAALRAIAAAAAVMVLAVLVPAAYAFLPIIVAVAVAIPSRRST